MAQVYLENVLQTFYDLEKWTPANNLISQGVVTSNLLTGSEANARVGKTITKSFDENIDQTMNFVTVESEAGTITPVSISSYTASFPYQLKSGGITSTEYEAIYKGQEGNEQAVIKQLSGMRLAYLRKQQSDLKSLADAVLATGQALEDHLVTTYNSSTFDGSNIRKALVGVLGEKRNQLRYMIAHSKVVEAMKTNKLVSYIANTDIANNFFANPTIPVFNNMLVVENDAFCAETSAGSNIYPIYCASDIAFDVEYSADLRITDVTSTVGGGTLTKQFTGGYGVYIPGLTYGSTSVADADVYSGANWSLAWDKSEIGLVRIDVQGE